jgi:hypothetical protein
MREYKTGGWLVGLLLTAALTAGCTDTGIYALNLGDVAVVTGDFDTPEGALDALEVPYTLVNGWHADGPRYEVEEDYAWEQVTYEVEVFFADPFEIGGYDVTFLSCGMRGAGAFVYNDASERDDQLVDDDTAVTNLREYVDNGGFVYATDWSYDLIEAAFPDQIDFLGDDGELDAAQLGEPQIINGVVVDTALREDLGMSSGNNEVEVRFDFDAWSVIEGVGDGTSVLVEGDIVYKDGADDAELDDSPLLVIFDYGHGKVVYTPFHTQAQYTTDVQDIINFLVFQFQQAEG